MKENKNNIISEAELTNVTGGSVELMGKKPLSKFKVNQQVAVTPEGGNFAYPQPGVVLEVKYHSNGWIYKVKRILCGAVDFYPENVLVPIEEAQNYMPNI